jgi:hypothetical protein
VFFGFNQKIICASFEAYKKRQTDLITTKFFLIENIFFYYVRDDCSLCFDIIGKKARVDNEGWVNRLPAACQWQLDI